MAKDSTLQVEQLFDDGSHPAIAEPLFSGEYGGERRLEVVEVVPVCEGQLSIEAADQ